MADLGRLPTWDDAGRLLVVVEAPRGSGTKLEWDPALGAIVAKRALPPGIAYPYDWGFVSGTRAPDGDPLDAMIVSEVATWPGVVVRCVPIGVVRVRQRETRGAKPVRNDRVLAAPADDPRYTDVAALPRRVRDALAEFFVRTGELAHAEVRVDGWGGPKAACAAVRRAQRAAGAA
jgi:inorganic pyrophosphatase